jgi:hypothetical protein
VVGEQHCDQGDRPEVVDDRHRQQQHPDSGRQRRTGQGQHAEGEGDVGGDRDRPCTAVGRRPPGCRQCDRGGQDHPARGGRQGQGRGPPPGQLADGQLPLDLKASDEEEDRQQPVGHPASQRQVQVQPRRPDRHAGLPHGLVGAAGQVRPQQRGRGGGQ